MMDIQASKTRLRALLRQRRNTIAAPVQRAAAQALIDSVSRLAQWREARRIAVYLAADGEIDPQPLAEQARTSGKQVFLPVINPDQHLHFAHWSDGCVLSPNRYGIPEPPQHATVCPTPALDIIFLPLVGWDLRGGRLGMGGGFYDRTLAAIRGPLLVGLGYEVQRVAEVPREQWDIALDYIATETALYRSIAPQG